jgi:hypothetical protein
MSEIKIQPLTEDHISKVCHLVKECWDDEVIENIHNEMTASLADTPLGISKIHFLLAFDKENFAGFSGWAKSLVAWDVYELCWAAVVPEHRHKGVNTAMLDRRLDLIKAAAGEGPHNVLVRTFDNPLYRSRGFVSTFDNVNCSEGKCLFLAHFGR